MQLLLAVKLTDPTKPINLQGVAGDGTVNLSWTASNDNVGVDHYKVRRSVTGSGSSVQFDGITDTSFFDDNGGAFLDVGSYDYTVEAFDAAGNHSGQSDSVTVVITGTPDDTAPTIPAGVTTVVTNPDLISGKDIQITWTASTDDTAVAGYGIYRNGSATPLATVNGSTLTYTDANLAAGTYTYTIDAVDSANNRSAQSAASDPLTGVIANDVPPATQSLIAFPARDFISATGYPAAQGPYTFQLIRGGRVFNSQPWPSDATGLVEVNHPGGACWNVNTPDMRPGDVIRIISATGVADQTRVANVTAERPVQIGPNSVRIKGTAMGSGGQRIPIDQIEHRLVSRFAFSVGAGNKKVLRAASAAAEGVLTYDSNNSSNPNWTATYTGLSANDMLLMFGGIDTAGAFGPAGATIAAAESRGVWLGTDPVAGTQLTIYENGPAVAGGPFDPSCGVLEPNVPLASFVGGLANRNFTTTFNPLVDSAVQTITLTNGGGSPLTINNFYFAGANPGDFVRTGGTCQTAAPNNTVAAGGSCTVLVTFRPTSVGIKQANLSFTTNAANTTDLTVPLTGTGTDVSNPRISLNPAAGLAFGTFNGGPTGSTQTIQVTNIGTGVALNVSQVTVPIVPNVTGPNPAADYTITAETCTGTPVASNGGTCSVTVRFRPGARTARTASLVLNHNATLPSSATTTSIQLSGTGGNGSVLTFKNNPVTFGTVNRGTSKQQTLSLQNTGNQAAALNAASFAVTGAGFSFVGTTCGNLAVNSSCNVTVQFTAPATIGAFVGGLSVSAPNGMPYPAVTSLQASTK